ncbi:MAG: ABC transporter ATP-binding protein [Planctomycetaceae bacterium]
MNRLATITHQQHDDEVLRLDSVSRSFGSQVVLKDVSFRIRRGDTHAVIGESGCGKSVTLKLMMALMEPTGGEVNWFGRPLSQRSEAEIDTERLRFGFLFQNAALFDSMTVFDNVAFGLKQNLNLSKDEMYERVIERLQEVGLPAMNAPKMPSELSGGMRKRVALARALVLEPDVMFYDEPTTGLDPIMSDVINELILRVRERREVTSVVVTHDMNTVRRVANAVTMLYPRALLRDADSQVIFDGDVDGLFQSGEERIASFVRGDAGSRIAQMLSAA